MSTINDIDFLIPVYIDHPDRLRNLNIAINYLNNIGAKNIFVNEHYKETRKAELPNISYISKDITNDPFYNKMVCGNEIFTTFSKNKVVCLYDIDVLLPKKFLLECADNLLNGYDFGYPFNGYFYDIPEHKVKELQRDLNTPILTSECKLFARESHGGCVMFTRECFIEGGKLNPLFKNVGFDDDEINVRFLRLGYKKYRTSNPLLHMTHYRGDTTYNYSKFVEYNGEICRRITNMPIEELKQLVKQWN